MPDRVKRLLYKSAKPLIQATYRQTRGMTLGTRSLVLQAEDKEVLLVRHSYSPGWLLPGGGVERGETLAQSALRELREEAGVEAEAESLLLHGMFLNDREFPGDHIACYLVRRFRREAFTPTAEISEARFFPVTELPQGTSPGTRRRLAEVLDGRGAAEMW